MAVADLFEALAASYADQALHDGLTGLANRELFFRRLHGACARAGDSGRVAVLFVDLDRFKQVNDTLGHQAGDALLTSVATRIVAAARPRDVVARLGGDEFAVLVELGAAQADATVPSYAGADVAAIGERLLHALRQPVTIAGTRLFSAASVGAAVSVLGGGDPETLLREADLAMYRAKAAGGARTEVVRDVSRALAAPLDGLGVDDTMARALRHGQFRVVYQPTVEIETGRAASVEALVRWQHPERGLLSPAAFLPAAEDTGLVVELGYWVLTEACHQLRRWDGELGAATPRYVNVNLAVRQMLDDNLVPRVLDALARTGIGADRLWLELPEAATLEQLREAAGPLQRLREAGVALTLDDLGSGASSLRHLTAQIVNGIKIDKSFVTAMLNDPRDLAIVRLLTDLAHALGVLVTAEGVETAAQLEALRMLGCTYAQGYYLARPAAAEVIADWLVQHGPRVSQQA